MTTANETTQPADEGRLEPTVRPRRTEWAEIRLALRQEYGHPYTYNGVPCMDFSRHVYVGRAGALLLKAEKQEAALRELVALKALKDRLERPSIADLDGGQLPEMWRDYERRKGPAWEAARDVLGPNAAVSPTKEADHA